ncbi:MAG: amidohydrolase [Proteobacteria bacterium]|nr:amidohydrolase [Pseudomonadota bacterium]
MEYARIDVDAHIQEPPDCWTSRMSRAKWGDRIPHTEWFDPSVDDGMMRLPYLIEHHERMERWVIDGKPTLPFPSICQAVMPDRETLPSRWEDVPPSVYRARERLEAMDRDGISAAVLYPNVTGPSADAFAGLDPEFEADCVRAYNDFLSEELLGHDRERFVALTVVPYSGIERTVAEVVHNRERGHGGVIMTSAPHQRGLPYFNDTYWDPLWSVCQEMDHPVHFHGSGGAAKMRLDLMPDTGARRGRALMGSVGFNLQGQYMSNFLFSGVFERFPGLTFVIAETGLGWVPYVLEACDHEWERNRLWKHGLERKPSEVFRDRVYVDFWYEKHGLKNWEFIGADRIMWESDFPHPTSLWPESAKHVEESLAGVPEEARQMILVDNARKVYKL